MRYALIGRGRMGRAIDEVARGRGHACVATCGAGESERLGDPARIGTLLGGADLAFEFSVAESAEAHVVALLGAGVAVICGTTGWRATAALERASAAAGVGLICAPNFSLGVEVFRRVVAHVARDVARLDLGRPWILEEHHAGKRDAPSGTARRLASTLLAADPRLKRVVEGNPEGVLPADALHVASLRADGEPGTHTVGFAGRHERIVLTHRANDRAGFALGAVLAAEWLLGRRGRHEFEDVVEELLSSTGGGRA